MQKFGEIDCEFAHHAPVIPFDSTMRSRAVFFSPTNDYIEIQKPLRGKTQKKAAVKTVFLQREHDTRVVSEN